MKKIYLLYFVIILFATTICISCSDWTETTTKDYFEKPSDEYYAALREYKQSKHQIAFGWFGNWSGEGASLVNSMAGIPDSVDLVSIWGNAFNISESQKKDLKFCQEVKGTKFLMCFIIQDIGDQITPKEIRDNYKENGFTSELNAVKDYWGWNDEDNISIDGAIRKYAKAIVDTIHKYNYDGFDIDYEPNYGHSGTLAGKKDRMMTFVDELGKYLGPKSGTSKLLVVDGEPQSMPLESGPYFDYFIIQSYYCPGDSDLNKRNRGLVNNFKEIMSEEDITGRLVMTENFEAVSIAMDGGYDYTDQYGNKMKSLEGMARWRPDSGFDKGGVGTYHMEAEYPTNPEYKNLRKAIQIMNPAPIALVKY